MKAIWRWIESVLKRNRVGLGLALGVAIAILAHPLLAYEHHSPPPSQPANTRTDAIFQTVRDIETQWERDYETYLGTHLSDFRVTADQIPTILNRIGQETGHQPALIYLIPKPDQLELVLITPQGKFIRKTISEATQEQRETVVNKLRQEITNPRKIKTRTYRQSAQQLYQWLITPIESAWQDEKIDTLLFCAGPGLRTVPFAALYDGQQFLIEKYNLALIPAFNMIPTRYEGVQNSQVLAMGASVFPNQLSPLPAVPVEVSEITQNLWPGTSFLNEDLTLANLRSQLRQPNYKIVHLATHAEFRPGKPENSYIQLWNTPLTLTEMRKLPWKTVELIVLSACRTAIGDREAEMGFAGLAVNSGAKTAIASLWYVSDTGTLALMTELYQHLKTAPIKAESLRQAQLAMLRGTAQIKAGELIFSGGKVPLPPELAELGDDTFSHPYFWSGFVTIGSPW